MNEATQTARHCIKCGVLIPSPSDEATYRVITFRERVRKAPLSFGKSFVDELVGKTRGFV
jgi:hypothetical protein